MADVELTTNVTRNGETVDVTVYEDLDNTGSIDNSETINGVSDGTNTYILSTLEGGSGNSYYPQTNFSTNDVTASPVVNSLSLSVPTPPPAPISVNASYISDDQIDVEIDGDTSGKTIDHYDVEMMRDGDSWVSPSGGPTSPAYSSDPQTESYGPNSDNSYDSQIGIDSSFEFRVRAVSSGGDSSAWTYSNTVYTTPIPPHNPSVSRPDANTVEISFYTQSDITNHVQVGVREDTGSGYGSWNQFDTVSSGESTIISGDPSVVDNTVVVQYSIGESYQTGFTLKEDSRYQFRIRTQQSGAGNRSKWVYTDYGNESNVYFDDDFESGDQSSWTSAQGTIQSDNNGTAGNSGADQGTYYSELNSGDTNRIELGDLSNESSVVVRFAAAVGSADNSSESGYIEWYDGSTWQEIEFLGPIYNRQSWFEVHLTIPDSYLSTDNQLRFRAINGSGDYLLIDRVIVSDILHEYTTPAAPDGLSIDTSVNREITNSWNINSSVTNTHEHNYRETGGSWIDEGWESEGFRVVSGLLDGEEYEFQVRSIATQDRNGTSGSSYWVSDFVTSSPEVTNLPSTNITSSHTDQNDVELELARNDNNDIGSFDVYETSSVNPSWPSDFTQIDTVNYDVTSYNISDKDGNTYHYVVVRNTGHTTSESSTSQVTVPFYTYLTLSGDGSIDNTRTLTASRVAAVSGGGAIDNIRTLTTVRSSVVSGSGSIDNQRQVVRPRHTSVSGTGSIDNETNFRAVFSDTLTQSYKWEYDQELDGFLSDWVWREADEDHGAVSLYIRGTFGLVDPASPTVKLYFDETGDGNIDTESNIQSIYDADQPVTFPQLDGDEGYYRILLRDLRPSDIITRVIFGPGHT